MINPAIPSAPVLEVVHGTVASARRLVTGGTLPREGGPAQLQTTPELWVSTADGRERRLVGYLLAEARPGHEVAVVLEGRGARQEVVGLVNLSTHAAWLVKRIDPAHAWPRTDPAFRWRDTLKLAAFAFWVLVLPYVLFLHAAFGPLAGIVPPGSVPALALGLGGASHWLVGHLGPLALARREARLAEVEAALAAAGVDPAVASARQGAPACASTAQGLVQR